MRTASLAFQGTEATNRVLRNTFLLLLTTLIPTIAGTFLGMSAGLPMFMAEHPWIYLILFFVVAFGLIMAIHATSDSAAAIPILWVFTGVIGASLAGIVSIALKRSDGAQLVALAAFGTALIMGGCTLYAMTTKRDFSFMGGFLFSALLAIIAISLLNLAVFHLPVLATVIACISLVVFSAYMVYDVQQIVNGGETNYILATVQVYLNMVIIFGDLLQIFLDDD